MYKWILSREAGFWTRIWLGRDDGLITGNETVIMEIIYLKKYKITFPYGENFNNTKYNLETLTKFDYIA